MTRPCSEKKSEPAARAASKVLPMEHRVGDRLADETRDWEVVARHTAQWAEGCDTRASRESTSLPVGRYEIGTTPSASASSGEAEGGRLMERLIQIQVVVQGNVAVGLMGLDTQGRVWYGELSGAKS